MSEYPAVINMSMISGATRVLSLTWKEANEPINLTNWTARLQIRSKTTSPAVALELTPPNGIVLDADGGIYIEFTPDHTEQDRKSTRLNSSHSAKSRMPSSA